MSNEPSNKPSGQDGEASGDPKNPEPKLEDQTPDPKPEDKVAYETHRKLLGEKKKLAERLADFERKEKEREEKELREKEDWKGLVESREKERDEERQKRQNLETTLRDGLRLDAFTRKVSGRIDDQYLALVNLDKIAVDPETGRPDEVSLNEYVREFEKQYPAVIQRTGTSNLPNDAPKQPGDRLTLAEWKKLPLKDKKERLSDVMEEYKREKGMN